MIEQIFLFYSDARKYSYILQLVFSGFTGWSDRISSLLYLAFHPPKRVRLAPIDTSGQIWCISPKAGEKDGSHSACPLRLHLLRQKHGQAEGSWDLGVQGLS
jgi:hypothetical protein